MQTEKIIAEGKNNPSIPANLLQDCLKAMFESSRTYGLFTAYFDEELYRYAATYYENHDFGRNRPMYAILGVAKVIEDVEISQRNSSPYRDTQRFLECDFAKIHKNEINIPLKFQRYLTARIDVKFLKAEGDFEILSVSDEKATVTKPNWYRNDGIGYVITTFAGQLNFNAKSTVDVKIRLWLRGLDVRDPKDKTKCIPYWIDYTKLIINGKSIFDTIIPAWHDKPYAYIIEAKAGEEIKLQVEWQPHRSDT